MESKSCMKKGHIAPVTDEDLLNTLKYVLDELKRLNKVYAKPYNRTSLSIKNTINITEMTMKSNDPIYSICNRCLLRLAVSIEHYKTVNEPLANELERLYQILDTSHKQNRNICQIS